MAKRTIPNNFPFIRPEEGYAGQLAKASVFRRLAQAQNYLWANLRRVYAATGYEGFGGTMTNMVGGVPHMNLDVLPDGSLGRPLSSFYCPRNWAGGTRLKVSFRYTLARTDVNTYGKLVVALYNLDDTPAGIWQTFDCDKVGTSDESLIMRVPQDRDYQVKVYLKLNITTSSETEYSNSCEIHHISARYMDANADDLHGITLNDDWANRYDLPTNANIPLASVFMDRIIRNTLWHYAYRNPELCQTYLRAPWNHTTTFTEVGRYVVNIARGVSHIEGRLYVYTQNGGAGCEVRVLVNGTVIQTNTALAVGNTEITVGPYALPSSGEKTITIEAKNLGGSYFGTVVLGVSFWESAIGLSALGAAATAPANYAPLDEEWLDGDDPIVALYAQGGSTAPAGIVRIQQNDRWLMANRPRHLIGDWRHRVLKRLDTFTGYATIFDPRVDWTRGDPYQYQPGALKNMTIRGTSGDDTDSFPNWPRGVGTQAGYSETPFIYPYDMTFAVHGRRLGRFPLAVPTGMSTHITNGSSGWMMVLRGRRLRPAVMASDENGFGTLPEEPPYVNKAYFEPVYDGTAQNPIPILGDAGRPDWMQRWHLAARGGHAQTSGVKHMQIRGRLPPQPTGMPPALRPEGMLFEVELNSVFIADEPLTADLLATL